MAGKMWSVSPRLIHRVYGFTFLPGGTIRPLPQQALMVFDTLQPQIMSTLPLSLCIQHILFSSSYWLFSFSCLELPAFTPYTPPSSPSRLPYWFREVHWVRAQKQLTSDGKGHWDQLHGKKIKSHSFAKTPLWDANPPHPPIHTPPHTLKHTIATPQPSMQWCIPFCNCAAQRCQESLPSLASSHPQVWIVCMWRRWWCLCACVCVFMTFFVAPDS